MLELLLVETVETNKDGSNKDQEEANRDDKDDQFSERHFLVIVDQPLSYLLVHQSPIASIQNTPVLSPAVNK